MKKGDTVKILDCCGHSPFKPGDTTTVIAAPGDPEYDGKDFWHINGPGAMVKPLTENLGIGGSEWCWMSQTQLELQEVDHD